MRHGMPSCASRTDASTRDQKEGSRMQPHTEAAPPDHFPTETTGLPACRRSEIVDLSDGATFELEIAAVAKQLGDARVRMHAYNGSIPGPTLGVAPGLGGGGQRRQPWGPGGDGPLARAAVEEPLRRHPRDADADPDRPERSLTRRLSGPGRVLVSPAHPRGLRPGDGPLWQRPRGFPPIPSTGRRYIARSSSRSMTS